MKQFRSRAAMAVAAMLTGAAVLAAQSPAPSTPIPAFEVISVKRSPPGLPPPPTAGIPSGAVAVRPGGRFGAPWVTVRDLIRAAYNMLDIQIVGGPDWMSSDRFNVEATTRPDVSVDDARAMLRSLLQQRFQLRAHTETRPLPASALEVARDDRRLGPQLRRSGAECSPMTPPAFLPGVPPPPPPPPGAGQSLVLSGVRMRCPGMALIGHMSLREITMPEFAVRLIPIVGRLVIDRSGLAGGFDLDLTYAPDPGAEPLRVNGAVVTIDAPALPAALRDQLGLRLETTTAPTPVVVVDSVQQPTEN